MVSNIKKLKINEKDFQKILKDDKDLNLSMEANDKSLVVDFSLLDYPNSFHSTYAYKIEGYDKEWRTLRNNQLTIGRLPYGDYKVKVKAKGRKETWSRQVLDLPLTVLRPFYLTWQFILLAGLAMIGIGFVLFKLRLKQLENRNLELEKVIEERTKKLSQTSKELASLNKTKDQFFAIIAHDLRGLVLSFRNVSKKVDFLQRKGRKEEVKDMLLNIDKAADNLSNLLDNLLNWALVEKGVFPYHPELFNLERLVIENIKLFTQLSRIKGIHLNYDVHETLNLYADKNSISTILRNLISNAMKYSREGDVVIIKAYKKEGEIQIEVVDTGEGIALNKLEHIFKLDSKKTKRGTMGEEGTGLGLVLCKELTELNNGDIKIESEEGKGTRVFVGLPLAG